MCFTVEEIMWLTKTLTSFILLPTPSLRDWRRPCYELCSSKSTYKTSSDQPKASTGRGTGHSPGRLPQWHFQTPGRPPRWPVLWLYVNRQRRGPFQTQSGLSQGHLSDQSRRLSTGRTLAKCLDLKMRHVLLVQNVKYQIPKIVYNKKKGPTKNVLIHAKR